MVQGIGRRHRLTFLGVLLVLLTAAMEGTLWAEVFRLPTENRNWLNPDLHEHFFVGTEGKHWTSGTFGCVRSEGGQFHEGWDIRCMRRDRRGEPVDSILAAADGTLVYANKIVSRSNYGKYVVLRHSIEGLEVFSLYAHLSRIRRDLRPGKRVRAGESIAIMGRTSNTRSPITKARAHLHFEIALMLNERFGEWYRRQYPKERNHHGKWNGQNLVGLDPALVFGEQQRLGDRFSLKKLIENQAVMCRVFVPTHQLSFLKRNPGLVRYDANSRAENVAGYDVELSFSGMPVGLIPRYSAGRMSPSRITLLGVTQAEYRRASCRKLVRQTGNEWILTAPGNRLIELIAY